MTDSSARSSSAEVTTVWERFYHLLGRGYAHIAQHPDVEAEILGLFTRLDTASIEGTELRREYRIFPTLFINFLNCYRSTLETVLLTQAVDACYRDKLERLESAGRMAENHKRVIRFANEQVSSLVDERKRLVDRLASLRTYCEHDPSAILMRLSCDWLEERIEYMSMDIALQRSRIRDLELVAEHHEVSVTTLRERCTRLFFKLAGLESQSAGCRHNINTFES